MIADLSERVDDVRDGNGVTFFERDSGLWSSEIIVVKFSLSRKHGKLNNFFNVFKRELFFVFFFLFIVVLVLKVIDVLSNVNSLTKVPCMLSIYLSLCLLLFVTGIIVPYKPSLSLSGLTNSTTWLLKLAMECIEQHSASFTPNFKLHHKDNRNNDETLLNDFLLSIACIDTSLSKEIGLVQVQMICFSYKRDIYRQ